MAQLDPAEILKVLERQAREDEAVEAEMRAIAAMSDAELDAELRDYGLDPAALEKEAEALFQVQDAQRTAPDAPVQAVAQDVHRGLPDRPARRRRPVALAVWLAAGAAAATAGGALLYSLTHHPHEEPAPPAPAPSPAPSLSAHPTEPPDLVGAPSAEPRKDASPHGDKPPKP